MLRRPESSNSPVSLCSSCQEMQGVISKVKVHKRMNEWKVIIGVNTTVKAAIVAAAHSDAQ